MNARGERLGSIEIGTLVTESPDSVGSANLQECEGRGSLQLFFASEGFERQIAAQQRLAMTG